MVWIEENPKEAEALFPRYSTDEGRMKLLTPKSAVLLSQEAREARNFLKELGVDNWEDAIKRCHGTANPGYGGYVGYDGIYLSEEEAGSMGYEELEAFCRMIGNEGEQFAFETVVKDYENKGYCIIEGEGTHQVLLKNEEGKTAEIYYPDTDAYHQQGWDIRVKEPDSTRYIEVKTHTSKSVKAGFVDLSRSQFTMAMGSADYDLALVTYSKKLGGCTGCRLIRNVRSAIAQGELAASSDEYFFRVA